MEPRCPQCGRSDAVRTPHPQVSRHKEAGALADPGSKLDMNLCLVLAESYYGTS